MAQNERGPATKEYFCTPIRSLKKVFTGFRSMSPTSPPPQPSRESVPFAGVGVVVSGLGVARGDATLENGAGQCSLMRRVR